MTSAGITYLGAALNLIVGLLKIVGGHLLQSKALVADGLHSLVDLSSDLAVLLGLRLASIPEDQRHPYGHHKFASFAQVFIALLIFLFAIILSLQAVFDLMNPRDFGPSIHAAWLALLSLVVKEWLFYATNRVARREKSRLLLANAWHHRTDSISSVITLIAILAASLLGPQWYFLDSLMAIILGAFLSIEGGRLLWRGIADLLDEAPEITVLNDIREHILPTPGAVGYHAFRARRIGDMLEVDLHLQVPPEYSVEQGHEIARQVRQNIMEKHSEVFSILIHVEPATEEHLRAAKGLFDREA